MARPEGTDKIILIDYDEEDAFEFFKDEVSDLSEYVFHHTGINAKNERTDIYFLRENYDKIADKMKEKYGPSKG